MKTQVQVQQNIAKQFQSTIIAKSDLKSIKGGIIIIEEVTQG